MDSKEKKELSSSQDKTLEKDKIDKNETQNLAKQEENQSGKNEIQNQPDKTDIQDQSTKKDKESENKNKTQSNDKTDTTKDVKNKEKQKIIKHLDSKLFATQELPEKEKMEEKKLLQDTNFSADNQDGLSSHEMKRRESIKLSVLNKMSTDQKGKKVVQSKISAVKKAALQSKNVTKTNHERTSTLQHRNSKGVLLKGSNVARSTISSGSSSESGSRPAPKARSTTNSRWTWDDPELVTALTIQKVNKGTDEKVSEPTKVPPNTAANNKPRSGDKSPLDKVRPKKIVVKPKENSSDKGATGGQSPQRRASVVVTGTALGSGSSPDRPLPERTPSKACSIQ